MPHALMIVKPEQSRRATRIGWRIAKRFSMLSYRHAFHAGNHADVLKHLALQAMLSYLAQKEAPLLAVDTHAGGGYYALDSEPAKKREEFSGGIARIWQAENPPKAVSDYLEAISALNRQLDAETFKKNAGGKGLPRYYPGSSWLMRHALRKTDPLRLFELHSNEVKTLMRHIPENDKTQIVHGDGLKLLKSLLPPPSRRALVLIDPSYETHADYAAIPEVLKDALKRFATGVYVIWYPIIASLEAQKLPERLKRLPVSWLNATLNIRSAAAKTAGFSGMRGSGLFIVNPPWKLEENLRESLPWLLSHLAEDEGANFNLDYKEASL